MNPILRQRLDQLLERHEEVGVLLGEPDVLADQQRFRQLSREYSRLEELTGTYREFETAERTIEEAGAMAGDADPELRELALAERQAAEAARTALEKRLQTLLLPVDPRDENGVYLEIRAGTGGDEAALFAGDLLRMYLRYAETRGWQSEMLSASEGEHGGFKEVIVRLSGEAVYSRLKFESGAHRVQRVPATESQGRIHTSACTVAVLPEAEALAAIEVNPAELRVDTYRASGAGGQHVNKTDSAVRLTHLPTGIVVECQDERSQHKNRAKAMALLQARLQAEQEAKQTAEESQLRRALVGSGDRSERIRTYNFPQGRLTDHRINLTLYKLEEIVAGDLEPVLDALREADQAEQLAALAR